jgi:hypothetical protein
MKCLYKANSVLIILVALSMPGLIPLCEPKAQDTRVIGIATPIIIEVSARAYTVEGKTKKEIGVDLFRIHCLRDGCSVKRLSLNRCNVRNSGQPSFKPMIDEWATMSGFVQAKLSNNVLQIDIFQASHHQLPAKITLSFDGMDKTFGKPISFEAVGFIDLTRLPDVIAGIEYQALKHDELKPLDCPVFLPGIHDIDRP